MTQPAHKHVESPEMLSLMGYGLAREAGQFNRGIELCIRAINLNPENPSHYLHLGRIYLMAKKKDQAIKVFRKGLKFHKDRRLMDELKQLGLRRSPPFQSLPRGHVINRMAGKILYLLKIR